MSFATNTAPQVDPREKQRPSRRSATRLPRPPHTRPNWLRVALGAALAVVVALGINAYTSSAADVVEVLALQNDVSRGERIADSDLVVVQLPEIESGLDTVPAAERDAIIGQVAAHDLLAGTTVSSGSVADTLTPPPGSSVVGVALSQSQMPAQPLIAGDRVRVVEIATAGGAIDRAEAPPEFVATVLSVRVAGSGITIVDLLVDGSVAADVASRAAAGRLALVIDSPEGDGR